MKCFVIAMQSEAEPVLKAADNVSLIKKSATMRVYECCLFKEKTAIVVCGVGKVNAAMGAQYACDAFKPEAVINLGVAGGLNDGVEVGGIYCVRDAVQYDVDLTQLNGGVIGTLNNRNSPYIKLAFSDAFPAKRVGTGDRFNDSKDDFSTLTAVLGADLRDMELGAIAQVCEENGIKCYSFKIVSDMAGNGSTTVQYIENLNICFKNLSENLGKIFKSAN